MGNVFVDGLRAKREAELTFIRQVVAKATTDKRELSAQEQTDATGAKERADAFKAQIDQYAWMDEDDAARGAETGRLAAKIDQDIADKQRADGQRGGSMFRDGKPVVDGAQADRGTPDATDEDGKPLYRSASGWYTRDRDPGHYRATKEGGRGSFFGDIYSAHVLGSDKAQKRLLEHHRAALPVYFQEDRAVTTGTGGTGLIAPHWLVQEYAEINRQARLLANRVRNIPLGGDYRPLTLPKQTAGTDSNVTVQTTEGQNNGVGRTTADMTVTNTGWGTDAYTSNTDTVTPKPYAAYQDISRQMLSMGVPAIDELIFADMRSVLDFKIETLVANTMIAAAVAGDVIPNDSPLSTPAGTSFKESGVATNAVIDALITAWANRNLPADIITSSIPRFGKFRKLVDSTGRSLMPVNQYPNFNANGQVTGTVNGTFEGLEFLPTAGMGLGATYPEKFLIARSQDTILFTDDILQFEFDQVVGPSNIRMGIWSYAAAITRYSGTGTVSVTVTAA